MQLICVSNTVLFVQANVRNYFMQFEESQTQSLIDSKIMEFEMKSRQGLQVICHDLHLLYAWLLRITRLNASQALMCTNVTNTEPRFSMAHDFTQAIYGKLCCFIAKVHSM